jgi:hypothetical protein
MKVSLWTQSWKVKTIEILAVCVSPKKLSQAKQSKEDWKDPSAQKISLRQSKIPEFKLNFPPTFINLIRE